MKFLFLAFLCILNLEASIGKISALNGQIVVDRNEKVLNANIGFEIEEKDIISTNDNSKTQITMNDGTVLTLGKNSKLNISEYLFDEKTPQESKANFKFVEGTFKSITGAIGKVAPERFKLETKSASIGIRGTIIVGSQERVACTQGQITVTSAGVTQTLSAGMMTNTQIGKAPTVPTKIEGNLLKEVDNVGTKEETKSNSQTTSASKEETKTNNENTTTSATETTTTPAETNSTKQTVSTEQVSTPTTTTTTQSNTVAVVPTLTEITKTVNDTVTKKVEATTTTQITNTVSDTVKKVEEATTVTTPVVTTPVISDEVTKKAEILSNALLLSNTISSTVQNINVIATTVETSTQTAEQIVNDYLTYYVSSEYQLSEEIQSAINNARQATISTNEIAVQASTISSEVTTLIAKINSASADESAVLYQQLQTKSSSLTTLLSDLSTQTSITENSLKNISLNLSTNFVSNTSKLFITSSDDYIDSFEEINDLAATTSQIAEQMVANASTKALQIAQNSKSIVDTNNALISSLYLQAKSLSDEISALLEKIKVANATDAVKYYQQIESKYNTLKDLLGQSSDAGYTALINSQAVQNVNFYSSTLTLLNDTTSSVGHQTFTVPTGGATVTIATYAYANDGLSNYSTSVSGIDPVLILLKWNENNQKFQVVGSSNDDGWTPADNYRNAILSLTLEPGIYKITVADYPYYSSEALKSTNNNTDEGTVVLYFTSSSNLVFESSENIEKYSYITELNNLAYIHKLAETKTEKGNAKFGVLADSAIGTSIQIDNYGYFVTISDSYLYKNDCTDCTNVFIGTETNKEVDDGSSWGYWTSDINNIKYSTGWISGNRVTPANDFRATFTGQVIGAVSSSGNTGYIKLDSNNLFQATIDIGSASISNSIIKFTDSLSGSWSGTFNTSGSSNVNTLGFSSTIVNNSNTATGYLSGSYYGIDNQVKSIGGAFNMMNGLSIANGVFKARAN